MKKKQKPVLVEYRLNPEKKNYNFFNWHTNWGPYKRYKNHAVAEEAIRTLSRKSDFFLYRIALDQ